jgi:hypothetical protein
MTSEKERELLEKMKAIRSACVILSVASILGLMLLAFFVFLTSPASR